MIIIDLKLTPFEDATLVNFKHLKAGFQIIKRHKKRRKKT